MRDDFTQQTLDILAKRVGVRCSNPSCRKLTTGPRSDTKRIINIGVGAHITAATLGGPRFDANLSHGERRSPENGVWLCQNCAKLIDNDPPRYTIETLRDWKGRAEATALSEIEGANTEQNGVLENSADLEISYKKLKMLSERHDYLLEVNVRNLGNEPLDGYHLDLEFPAKVLEISHSHQLYVKDRSNQNISFFRVVKKNGCEDVYPGDIKLVMSIPYYMSHDIYFNRGNLFTQPVRATLHRTGFRPLTVEKLFGELQFF